MKWHTFCCQKKKFFFVNVHIKIHSFSCLVCRNKSKLKNFCLLISCVCVSERRVGVFNIFWNDVHFILLKKLFLNLNSEILVGIETIGIWCINCKIFEKNFWSSKFGKFARFLVWAQNIKFYYISSFHGKTNSKTPLNDKIFKFKYRTKLHDFKFIILT